MKSRLPRPFIDLHPRRGMVSAILTPVRGDVSSWDPDFAHRKMARLLQDSLMIDKVSKVIIIVARCLILTVVCSIKALLPINVLPRKNVKGEIVLITGSGSGLGRLMAIEFAKLGSKVVLWDINEKANLETKRMIEELKAVSYAYTVDLSKKEQIYGTAEQVKTEVGKVDILINNAGIATGKKFFECPDDFMELTMAVNTISHFFTTKAFLPAMMDENHGHIVTVASMAGKIGASGLVDYCASKHGAVGFHESLTAELNLLGKIGVKTTVVCPYYTDTPLLNGVEINTSELLPILKSQDVVDDIMEAILTNRRMVVMPKFFYFLLFALSFLPSEVMDVFKNYIGGCPERVTENID